MKKITLIIMLSSGFLLAGGGGGGGSSGPYTPSGDSIYRCFKDLGKSTSNQKFSGQSSYCAPTQNGTCSYEWNLDLKNDNITSTGSGCNNFTCSNSLQGMQMSSPVDIYKFCVLENKWSEVAQCVDKSTGNVVSNNTSCSGNGHYWKPKCDNSKSIDECINTLKSRQWYQCENLQYNGFTGTLKTEENGYVKFQEYCVGMLYTNANGRCNGSDGIIPCKALTEFNGSAKKDDVEPGKLVIKDFANTKAITTSLVWTKTSGNSAEFAISSASAAGSSFNSGLKQLHCNINSNEMKEAQETGQSWLGMNKVFKYSTTNAFPTSGNYKIACSGLDTNGKAVAGEVEFQVVPASYQYDMIEFRVSNDKANNGLIEENLIDISNPKKVAANKTETITHDNKSWVKKPVVKVGENIVILARSVTAYNAKNIIDTGVNSTINVSNKNTLKAIASSGIPNTVNATSCGSTNPNIETNNFSMQNGIATLGEHKILTLNANNSLLGNMELTMQDSTIKAIVDSEKAAKKCDSGSGSPSCPYPGIMKLTFDYQVVPQTFDIELLNHKGDKAKVLYFGQGNNPAVEGANKVKIIARDLSNNKDTTFTNGCGAQDIQVDLTTTGTGYSIKLVDKDGKDLATIPRKDFKNGEATSDIYIKVEKASGIEFTPNMKSEPVFIDGGFPATIQFAGFAPYPTSYYPNYEGLLANAIDMVILRARINAIDTDNNVGSLKPNNTKVYYEFQCEYCNLSKLQTITGVVNYQTQKSKTQQGWFIDSTFNNHNATTLTANMVSVENQNGKIASVSAFNNGIQEISYNMLTSPATHKVNILHGSYMNGGNPISMPNFLLYNAYWNSKNKWYTSAFIYMKGKAEDEDRNYGLDTGGAKNTRSGGRTGKY